MRRILLIEKVIPPYVLVEVPQHILPTLSTKVKAMAGELGNAPLTFAPNSV
jgi:hypothetical protein